MSEKISSVNWKSILVANRCAAITATIKKAYEIGGRLEIQVFTGMMGFDQLAFPAGYDHDSMILLNITPNSIGVYHDDYGFENIEFNARFNGKDHHLVIPKMRIVSILLDEEILLFFTDVDVNAPAAPSEIPLQNSSDQREMKVAEQVKAEIEGAGSNVISMFSKRELH